MNKLNFKKALGLLLVMGIFAGMLLTSCGGTNDGGKTPDVDILKESKELLKMNIDKINGAYFQVSDDGADILTSEKWTTQEAKTKMMNAVAAAKIVLEKEDANITEVKKALEKLHAAMEEYNNAAKPGSKKTEAEQKLDSYVNAVGSKIEVSVVTDADDAARKAAVEAAVVAICKDGPTVEATKVDDNHYTVVITVNNGTDPVVNSEPIELTIVWKFTGGGSGSHRLVRGL